MYECISIRVYAAYDNKDKIKMLATCLLATFAQGLCCHVFEVLIRTFKERANGDQVLFNFRWSSRIKGNNTPKSWMKNHRHLTKMTLQGERGRTIVGLLHCGGVVVPVDGLTSPGLRIIIWRR
jgi:hypothetical protein